MRHYAQNRGLEPDGWHSERLAPSCNDTDDQLFVDGNEVSIPFVQENLTDQGWLDSDESFSESSKPYMAKVEEDDL